MPEGVPNTITGAGRLIFIGLHNTLDMRDNRMEVWEVRESGATFQFRQSISWRAALPQYDPGPEDDFDVTNMDCTEELLAVAFRDGLVTLWGWRAGVTALELLTTIDFYHAPAR